MSASHTNTMTDLKREKTQKTPALCVCVCVCVCVRACVRACMVKELKNITEMALPNQPLAYKNPTINL